jgi:hypothetical protein
MLSVKITEIWKEIFVMEYILTNFMLYIKNVFKHI